MLAQSHIAKEEKIKESAETLYAARPNWIAFYKEIFGSDGVIRRHYPTLHDLEKFEGTEVYQQLQRMLTELRRVGAAPDEDKEPTRVITVRIPKTLHESLRDEAYEHKTSMNKLCISKLLQIIDQDRVPKAI